MNRLEHSIDEMQCTFPSVSNSFSICVCIVIRAPVVAEQKVIHNLVLVLSPVAVMHVNPGMLHYVPR